MRRQLKMKIQIPKSILEKELLDASPAYFATRVFNYIISDHHQAMLNHIQNHREALCLAPRGHGKSRICNIAYNAWLLCTRPNCRVLIISDTDRHSIRFLQTIKSVLEHSDVIKRNYGNMVGKLWSDHAIITALRTDNSLTEASLTALGALSGQATSGHHDYINADDLVNFESTRSASQRERTKNWFLTTLMPTLLPNGSIYALGTLYHHSDVYYTMEHELGFKTLKLPAIIDEGRPTERALWESYRPLHTRKINGHTVKGLIEMRDGVKGTNDAGLGSLVFNLQYQLDATLQKSGSVFHYDWFQFYNEAPSKLRIYQGVDLAISKRDSADFFVILTLGISAEGDVYVLDIYKKRGVSFNEQQAVIIQKAAEWKPEKIAIETNSYQAALAQEVKRLSLLPIIELTTSKDKTLRAQMRSGLAESGRVYVKADMHDFIAELTMLDQGALHDDMFDAFDFALTAAEAKTEEAIQEGYYIPDFETAGIIV